MQPNDLGTEIQGDDERMSAEYEKPDWCAESTWGRAKHLVHSIVPQSLMARTGRLRIEIAATELIKEANEATEKAGLEVKVLSGALAGMLDAWSGYPTPECDAAISAMQYIGIDRWSAQAAIKIIENQGVPKDEVWIVQGGTLTGIMK